MTELENRAHAQKALVSSDAIRFFMKQVSADNQNETLDAVIAEAKTAFPAESGWVVLNLSRFESLLAEEAEVETQKLSSEPITAGSLAEAIALGDIAAAYTLVAHRPMIALADATADFDALYRSRKGADVAVSDLLTSETKNCSDETIKAAVEALTAALDGTYESEAAAVKTAIMKAATILNRA